MDADKVEAVASWPVPRSTRALRGFLGLAGYYRKFIRDFEIIAAPLTRLLRRDAFAWDEDAETAFRALKGALTTGPYSKCRTSTRASWWTATLWVRGLVPSSTRAPGPSPSSARHLLLGISSSLRMSASSLAWCRLFDTRDRTCGGATF